jgi:hypothetical protein
VIRRGSILLTGLFFLALGFASLTAVTKANAAEGLDLHGWMANRIYGEPGVAHFQAERLDLYAGKDIDPHLKAYFEFYYHHWVNLKTDKGSPWFLDSAFVDFIDSSGNRLRVGKGRDFTFGLTPIYGNRKTSEYGLIAETFTQERIIGAQYFGTTANKKLDFGISVHNALPAGSRNSGTDQAAFRDEPVVPHLADKGEGKNLAESARLAIPVFGTGRLGVSYRTGNLRDADLTFLAGKDLIEKGTDNHKNNQWGVDYNYKTPSGIVTQAEYYSAKMSTLDFNGWDALLGYEPKNPMGIRSYVRYGKLNLDPPEVTDNTYTWDQNQWIVSFVKPLRQGKPVWLQLEWIKNNENPPSGVDKVENDVVFLELFTGF